MMPPTDRPSGIGAARADARRRFDELARRAAPVFSPAALGVCLALTGLTGLTMGLQFATPLLDAAPLLTYTLAFSIAALSFALIALVAVRRVFERGAIVACVAAVFLFILSLGCAGARSQWQRGLSGNSHYAPAAHATRFPKDAQTVDILTADGVHVRGTTLGGRRPHGVVIVPSWRSNRDGFAINTLATWLANDLDVLVIDPRGQGDSDGAKSPDVPERLDILAAVGFMRASGHDRVGVLAEQDAAVSALFAVRERRDAIDALALVGPSTRWGDSLTTAWDPESFSGRLYWRVAAGLHLAGGPPGPRLEALKDAIKHVAPVPLLIIGTRTDVSSAIDAYHSAAGDPKSLIVIGGEGRPIPWSHFAAYYAAVAQWLSLALDPAPAASR